MKDYQRKHLALFMATSAVIAGTVRSASAQTSYAWVSGTTGNWSTTTDWTPNGNPGSLDTANINDTSVNETVTYDSAATGSLSTLNMAETSGFSNILSVQKNLTVANALTLGATGTGSLVDLQVQPTTSVMTFTDSATAGITLNSGGELDLLSSTTKWNNSPVLASNVTISGGTLTVGPAVGTTGASGSYNPNLIGNLTMTSGTLNIFPTGDGADANNCRMYFIGNVDITGGAEVTSNTGTNNAWYFLGASNIYCPTTASGGWVNGYGGIFMNGGSNNSSATGPDPVQTMASSLGSSNTFVIRANGNDTVQLGFSDTSGNFLPTRTFTISNGLQFGQSTVSGDLVTLQCASNVTLTGSGLPGVYSSAFAINGGKYAIDVDGHIFNMTTTNQVPIFTAQGESSSINAAWTLTNSATSVGTFQAGSYNLAGNFLASSSVGPNIVLMATGAQSAGTTTAAPNNLGGPAGTIDPTSTFWWNSPINGYLVSNRAIGGLHVSGSVLSVNQTSLTAGGPVTAGTNGTLDLDGTTAASLTITNSAALTGQANGQINFNVGTGSGVANGSTQIIDTGGTFNLVASNIQLALSGNVNPGAGMFDYGNSYALLSGFASGSTTLLSFTGSAGPGSIDTNDYTPNLSVGNPGEPTAGSLYFTRTNGPASITWTNASPASGNGQTWQAYGPSTTENWLNPGLSNGTNPDYYFDGDNVTFNDSNNSNYAVTVVGPVTPGSVTVNNSTGNYTISGSGSIADAGAFTKSGTGTLTLGAALTAPSVSITGGTLKLANSSTGGGPGTISTINISSLSITGTSQLDVNNDHIIIDYTGSSPMATIAAYVKSGYNLGGWNGPGIMSTAAQTLNNGRAYGVGYADGADHVVSGLSSGQIEVAYTLLGDANLDGIVNGIDFGILSGNYGQPVTSWDQGDFNYDGIVNGIDFGLLSANYGQADSGAATAGDLAALDAFAVANGLPIPTTTSVPEPASLGLLTLGAVGILARRRRKL